MVTVEDDELPFLGPTGAPVLRPAGSRVGLGETRPAACRRPG
jgi:hypothetical protein